MKRFNCNIHDKRGVIAYCMETNDNGTYVNYEDAMKRIVELEKELVTSSKNNIATEILNIMEREKVENFSIDVFKTDNCESFINVSLYPYYKLREQE